MGMGTFAISLACEYQMKGDEVVPNTAKYEFSIKCHNSIHLDTTDYHGPPQTSSIGVMMSSDFFAEAKPLSKPKVVGTVMNSTGSMFAGNNLNPFQAVAGVPSAQAGEKQSSGVGFL